MEYNLDDDWQSFLRIFSGNRVQTRAGVHAHSWVVPILEQVMGLRMNYLGSDRLQPPGSLRPRTRNIYPRVSSVGPRNSLRFPSVQFAPHATVPGMKEMNTWILPLRMYYSVQHIIFMLRVWFRRAIRNARNRLPLPDRRVRLRLTYNPALD